MGILEVAGGLGPAEQVGIGKGDHATGQGSQQRPGLFKDPALFGTEPGEIGIGMQRSLVVALVVPGAVRLVQKGLQHDAELEHELVHPYAPQARQRDGVRDLAQGQQDLALHQGHGGDDHLSRHRDAHPGEGCATLDCERAGAGQADPRRQRWRSRRSERDED